MRSKRLLLMMAGLIKAPAEKHLERQQRKLDKLARDWKRGLELISAIQARERGDDGTKPMPFGKPKGDK